MISCKKSDDAYVEESDDDLEELRAEEMDKQGLI